MYRITLEQTLHSAPIGIGHNSIVVVPGPTFGLASVGIVDESGNLMDWLMEDEPLEDAMAFAQNKSKPLDWDTDNETAHFTDCQWLIGGDGFICSCPARRDNAKDR
tara:strand:+ start:441 stop:758 length:318 start_codon:yes stop_codon:yes gene_type:complete